ncbi:uncharacterized protein LOC134818153 [Bolinopsis microptera]|uniref:uncharacterized protein LOC134818153 n=1 Tax=Bolinopsis microptera TaxID=2820187 RepID=UPI00307A4423
MAFITLMFAGHISPAHLAGVGLTNTLFNLIVVPVSAGYASVFDTYGPQVYGFKGELGTVFLKCLLQGWLLLFLVLGPYLNIVYIIDLLPYSGLNSSITVVNEMAILGQGDFRDIAVNYLRITFIVEFLDYTFTMISKYFAIQEQTKFVYLVSIVMIVSHCLANYVLVVVLKLGLNGLGVAAIVSRILPLTVSLTICCVMIKQDQFAWNGFSARALLGWKPMMKLGISGALNVFAEMVLFEISTFCSQFDGAVAFSVVIIAHQLVSIWWSIALGMSEAAATLIGTAMGEGDAEKTKLCMKLTVVNSVLVSSVLAVVSYCLMSYEITLFSSDNDVKSVFMTTFWIICLGIPVDHIQTSLNQGILVSFGAQNFTCFTMSIACYGIGLPIVLGTIFFTDMKVAGVFIGLVAAALVMLVCAVLKIRTVNIENEIEKSRKRVGVDPEDEDPLLGEDFLLDRSEVENKKEMTRVILAFVYGGLAFFSLGALSMIRNSK